MGFKITPFPLGRAGDGLEVAIGLTGGITTGKSTNLSFINTPKPAIGIEETLVNFSGAGVPLSILFGVSPETFAGMLGVPNILLLPKESKFERKFVPVVSVEVLLAGL